ncbi:MAG: hypothetical protein U0572_09355 [Phycisphaerales bacterium]
MARRPVRSGPGYRPADAADRLRAELEALHEERLRLLRQRRVHLTLLGLAISLPIHILLILWLATIYLPGPIAASPPGTVFELGVLNDERLAEGLSTSEDLSIADSAAAAASDASASLEATQPSVGLDQQRSGALEAAGGGPVGAGAPGGGTGLGPGGGGGGTSFFGVGGRGTRFAYIVDVSGSMSTGARMQVSMDELKRSISALPDFASFAVYLYSDHTIEPPTQDGYSRAMPSNVARLRRWLDEQGPMGGTDPGPAFERALTLNPPPDIIFFLTDGEIPPHMPEYLASRNGGNGKRKVVIHCIAFSSDAGQETLRRIARENEGTFRFVPVAGLP